MKKILIAAAALALGIFTANAQETIYSLPQTVITVDVKAEQQVFHAGPYAEYAWKYLGIEVGKKSYSVFNLKEVKIGTAREIDYSARYRYITTKESEAYFNDLMEKGLIVKDGTPARSRKDNHWTFTSEANPASREFGKLRNTLSTEINGNKIEEEAKAAAKKILQIRTDRYAIMMGDTDASYSGEALGAFIAECNRQEQSLMPLFIGYTETTEQEAHFEIVPKKGTVQYPAFSLSDEFGLLPAESESGAAFSLLIIEESAEAIEYAAGKKAPSQTIKYRVPANCTVKLLRDGDELLGTRASIFQFGSTTEYPIYK